MLLTLFRLTMIVPLLIPVCVETNAEKLSFVPSEEKKVAAGVPHRRTVTFFKGNEKSIRDEDRNPMLQKRQLSKNNRYFNEQNLRMHRGIVSDPLDYRIPRSDIEGTGGLAHKMAKDALKSPKVQETIRKLSRVSPPGHLQATVKIPMTKGNSGNSKASEDKRNRKGVRHKGRKKKKKKRHHRRYMKQPTQIKRGSPKRTLDSNGDINTLTKRSKRRVKHATIKRSPDNLDDRSRENTSNSESRDAEVTAVHVDDSDYVDFSSSPNIETTESIFVDMQNDEKLRNHGSEKMIERLMRTTTKNPWKEKSGDQGVEYSDYYSDDEVLQDVAANKILPQLIGSRDPYDRLTRQTLNFTSYRDCSRPSFDRNVLQPYYPDYDTRSRKYRGFKNDYVNSLNNFQNYPTNDRIATLNRNSRVLGPDEATFNYAPNYGVLDYRSQNYDTSYPAPNVPAEVPEDPQVFEGNNVSELSNNYETFEDPNKPDGGVRQPVVESQNPDQFEYSNSQYEIPGEQYQSLSTNMPQNLNLNGAVEPLIQPQYLNNYQIDSNPLGGNFDQTSIMSQAESMRIPNADTYFPIQFYNNQQDSQENQIGSQDKSMDNYALQSTFYNRPSVNLPNAMDQPLGKILESLGINVNGGQNNNNKEMNMNENRQILPYSNNDRTLDVINFIRKRPYDESTGYGDSNFRGLDYQSFSKNNVKEDQRQSSLNQNYSFGKENVDRDHTNITGAVRDTKQVANEILDTIMEELEDLKDDRMKNNKNREGLPCRLSGSWSTTQAGVKLDMRVVNRTIVVTLSNFTSSRLQESLLNETWNVSGHVPFKRGLPFTLIATHNYTNSIAVFVGACRVCQGIDTIAGVWSVARQPKDCKDLQAATSVFNDIFRKTQLSSLKEGENTDNATLKHNKTKS